MIFPRNVNVYSMRLSGKIWNLAIEDGADIGAKHHGKTKEDR